jgi:hypothetical protein
MKTINLIVCIVAFCACNAIAQTPTPNTPTPDAKQAQPLTPANDKVTQPRQPNQQSMPGGQNMKISRYLVQIPHTKEQCGTIMNEMREKGAPMMMRFDWTCEAGVHNGYAVMPGQSEDAVRKQLPEGVQKMAKIIKTEKAPMAQAQQVPK